MKRAALLLLLLIIIAVLAVQTSTVQTWLVGIATKTLSKELGTRVSVESINFSLFNKVNINGVFVGDKKRDYFICRQY